MPGRQSLASTGVVLALQFMCGSRSRGENHADFRYERYTEDNGRVQVETYSAIAEQAINDHIALRAQAVYDGISGATPTGAPPPVGSNKVPTVEIDDIRRAGSLAVNLKLANHTLSPQFAYSKESDYKSFGVSLTDAIDFNEKNTTLVLGLSHDFDSVQPEFWPAAKRKDSTDIILGVNQLLDPKTVLTVNLTLGYSDGYLADPYRGVRFDGYPDPNSVFPEKRPGHKSKEVGYVSLTRFFDPLNASAELSYRLYHDSYGILAHTVTAEWFQKLGKRVILAPIFRYYTQTEADFYAVRLAGDPSDPASTIPIPDYYSADYRLAALETFTYGLRATYILNDHLWLDAGYKRYEMIGADSRTPSDAFPKAHIFSIGVRGLW
jgi:hypothetical protein